MNAQRFREDNTEGYSASELAELNRLFEQAGSTASPRRFKPPSTTSANPERVRAG
jgi:hypothetical protein